MLISKKDVEHVAKLARLELSESEAELFSGQLGAILSYVEKLGEIDVENVEPTSHVVPMTNYFRNDEIRESLASARVMKNSPDSANGCFRVPKVVE